MHHGLFTSSEKEHGMKYVIIKTPQWSFKMKVVWHKSKTSNSDFHALFIYYTLLQNIHRDSALSLVL